MFKRVFIFAFLVVLVIGAASAFAAQKKATKADTQKALNTEYAQAVALVNAHKWDAAIEALTKIIDNPATPKDIQVNALVDRGSCLTNKRMDAEGVADFTKALDMKPDLESALYNRARALARLNKHEEAITDLTKAIQITQPSPIMASYYKNRGMSYLALEKRAEAKADFKKAKEINPRLKLQDSAKELLKQP